MIERKKLPVSVLIVDDEPMIVEQLGLILRRRVEVLHTAVNGQEALECYQRESIDVIISDIDMPVMNGIALLKAIRAIDPRLPFILSTGLKSLDILIEAIEHGITLFLPKPLQKNDLIAKIEEVARTKELEHQVQETQALLDQYKAIVDTSIIVSKADPQGNITYVNDIFCAVSGYNREELIGQSHSIVRDPQMPANVFAHMWQTIQAKKSWHGIIHNKSKNGQRYTVRTTISPILDKHGDITEYIALREDITEAVEIEKTIRNERKNFDDILSHVDSIVAMVSLSEKLMYVNQKFYEIFPYSSLEQFKKRHSCICDLFQPREGYLQSQMGDLYWVEHILAFPEMSHHAVMIDKWGNERKFLVNVRQIRTENKQKFVVTLGDVTELQKAKEDANAAARMKGDFLATMSHEIRTPMNGILGFTSLLSHSGLNEQQKKYLDIINTSTQSLLGIINDILDFSKLESGKLELDYSSINPLIEFDKIAHVFSAQMMEKQITFDIEIDPLISECIQIDLLRTQQIISNLLSNAVKFTPSGGRIVFYVSKVQEVEQKMSIRIGVKDSGIGIATEQKEKIFDAFSQADSSTTRKFGGTGLGLSISSHLASLMDGKLTVESEEGKGSDFYFELTVKKCMAAHPLYSYFTTRKITVAGNSDTLTERRIVTSYLDKLRIPYQLSMASNGDTEPEAEGIYILFCDSDKTRIRRHIEKNIFTIVVCRDMDDLVESENITHIRDLEHNLSALYNTLLHSAQDQEKKALRTGQSGNILLQGKVLVAEDNTVNQMLIEEYLNQYGIQPMIVENGQRAVEQLEHETYDLILMDVNMPVLSGIDALAIIKRAEIATPVVALTANAMEGDNERFLENGFDHYLAKPIDLKVLEALLRTYLLPSAGTEVVKHEYPHRTLSKSFMNFDRMKKELQLPETILHKLLNAFLESFDSSFGELQRAVESGELEKIENAAHYIKGAAANLRIHSLESLAKEIEVLAKLRAVTECREVFQKIEEIKEDMIVEIRNIVKG